jgi:hypothetical protein
MASVAPQARFEAIDASAQDERAEARPEARDAKGAKTPAARPHPKPVNTAAPAGASPRTQIDPFDNPR